MARGETTFGRVDIVISNAGILRDKAFHPAWSRPWPPGWSPRTARSPAIYSAGGGRVARFFVGLTQGYANPALTLEDVRDQFGQIRDETGYSVPAGVADELSALVERLR